MATEGVRTPKKRAATEGVRCRKARGTREQKHADALRRGDTDKTVVRECGQNEITEAPGFPGASV